MIKQLFKYGSLILLLPVLSIAALLLWSGYQWLSYEQLDNAEKISSKTAYLKTINEQGLSVAKAPNIVFILFDDLGYGDLGFTGSRAIDTPNLDQLAAGGVVLNNFYSPSAVCTPARAGYLTGRFAHRAGIPDVVFPTGSLKSLINILPGSPVRLPAEEITVADILQAAGYSTAMIGKWHLGDRSPSLPNDMGFKEYFGALYSNDMQPFALYRNTEIAVPAPVDQTTLNEHYASAAESFIAKNNSDQPFFLYYAHNFPHRPLYSSEQQAGRSSGGLYGDVVEDIDSGVGRIVSTLKNEGLYENTLIIVSSDNGPWYQGSPGSVRGRKGDTFEGGMRVPFIAHWPARLRQGKSSDGISMGTDLLPTLLDWLQLPPPKDRIIDGLSIRHMLESGTESPHDYLYYMASSDVVAIRDQRFKYHAKRPVFYAPMPSPMGFSIPQGPWLIDMTLDDNEAYDVSILHKDETERLAFMLKEKRLELLENPRGWR